MQQNQIDSHIYIIESQLKMPLMQLPIKSTLIRIDSKLILHSPVPNISEFKRLIDEFGLVTDIVAPNLYHNLGVKPAINMFPNAELWAVKDFNKKNQELNYQELNIETWPYNGELELFTIEGQPSVNESVFLHKRSKTLIVTDLCFNHIHGKGIGNWIIFKMFGTYKRFAVSKFFLGSIKDRQQFKLSLNKILAADFDNIIIPHGVNIIGGAKQKLVGALKERGY